MTTAVFPCNQLWPVNWPKTLVLSEGRDSITPRNTTSTRRGVGEHGSMLEGGTQLLKPDKEH